jgi:hypothetical protein
MKDERGRGGTEDRHTTIASSLRSLHLSRLVGLRIRKSGRGGSLGDGRGDQRHLVLSAVSEFPGRSGPPADEDGGRGGRGGGRGGIGRSGEGF